MKKILIIFLLSVGGVYGGEKIEDLRKILTFYYSGYAIPKSNVDKILAVLPKKEEVDARMESIARSMLMEDPEEAYQRSLKKAKKITCKILELAKEEGASVYTRVQSEIKNGEFFSPSSEYNRLFFEACHRLGLEAIGNGKLLFTELTRFSELNRE